MQYGFCIGQVNFFIHSEEELIITDELDQFHTKEINADNADITYNVFFHKGVKPSKGDLVAKGLGYEVHREGKEYTYSYNVGTSINPYKACLRLSKEKGYLTLPEEHREELNSGFNISVMLGIEQIFMEHRHIIMHASVIDFNGKGLLFSGVSGVGKSTQAQLWQKYRGAEILNGDRTVLSVSNKITAYGSPYSGSSGIIKNKNVPVHAILLLEKSEENKIDYLGKDVPVTAIYKRFSLLPWDPELCIKGIDLIDKIVRQVPIYRFKCRADESAVDLVYQTVFEKTGDNGVE